MTYLDTDRNGVITYATELLHFFIPQMTIDLEPGGLILG
jgi:hypothetical protein